MKILTALLLGLFTLWPQTAPAKSDRCVVVVPRQGDEALVNTCNQCRMVEVSRARPGGGPQAKRTFAVPANTKVDLTFHGPGKTRVHAEMPCGTGKKEQGFKQPGEDRPDEVKCLELKHMGNGMTGLFNSCPVCQAGELEYYIRNVGAKRETTKVGPRSVAVLEPHPEAVNVRIRRETTCGGR